MIFPIEQSPQLAGRCPGDSNRTPSNKVDTLDGVSLPQLIMVSMARTAGGLVTYLVEVPTADGAFVSVAVAVADEGVVRAARPGQVVARASRTLDDMVSRLCPVVEAFVAQFRSMADAPDELTVQFGVTLSASADVVIASAATEANFAVTLNWTSKRQS